MKTRIILTTAILTVAMLATTTGCDKLKKKLFKAFTTGTAKEDFTIPIINDTTAQADWGTVAIKNMNIDSIIKAETGGLFSLKDVKKVSVNELRVKLKNADMSNNFANFKEGKANFNTNTNPTVIAINSGLNPDVYSDDWIMPSLPDVNLKDYIGSTAFNYILYAKARRVTTKVLNATLEIKFTIE